MSNEELLINWERLLERLGQEEAMAALMATKKVSASTADRLTGNRYRSKKPSRRTREALLEVVGSKAS